MRSRALLWVLEDSLQQAALVERVLSVFHDVRLFRDSADLLEAMFSDQPQPDVLVLDWHLPDISGVEVLRVVRQTNDEVTLPVLILTGAHGSPESALEALDAGANDYATKPFAPAELQARVATLVRIRSLHDRARRAERDLSLALGREGAARAEAVAESLKAVASERKLRLVTDALPVLVSFVNEDERYGYVNQAYEQWFGQSGESLVGRTVREVVGETAYALLEPYVRRGLAGERFSFEHYDVPYRIGGTRDIRVTFVPLHLDTDRSRGYVALVQDITAQRALQLERERLAQQKAETLARQAQFEQHLIGIVSHDLRTPLQVISLSSHLLALDEGLNPAATKKVVRIQNATLRATRLVGDLLDFTKARLGGGIPIARQPTDIHQLVQALLLEIEAMFPERQVECIREGSGAGSWDPERITQMAQNLITNALKYSPPSSVVRVSMRACEGGVELVVNNAGPIIPKETQARLFEPLQRGAGMVDTTTRSVGLGLYIVKEIVQAHAGTVHVASTVENGTSFVVVLPLA